MDRETRNEARWAEFGSTWLATKKPKVRDDKAMRIGWRNRLVQALGFSKTIGWVRHLRLSDAHALRHCACIFEEPVPVPVPAALNSPDLRNPRPHSSSCGLYDLGLFEGSFSE
jgi:hypothetical protein